MDVLKEVVDSFGLFIKNFQPPDTDDFDLWKTLQISQELQSSSTRGILQCLEKLILQLQTIKGELSKKDQQEVINVQDAPMEVNDSKDVIDNRNSNPKHDTTVDSGTSNSPSNNWTCSDRDPSDRSNINPNIVQIKASRDEIERRISAFIEKKQREVNQLNNREFCSVITPEAEVEFSCARTDAVFVPRAGCKSHIKISRVVNPYGPQTKLIPEGPRSRLHNSYQGHQSESTGLEERLKNIESHLQLQLAGASKSDLYGRLKTLEDRILFLEGLSPEYFQNVPQVKRQRLVAETRKEKNPVQDLSLEELDERIQSLQASLQLKKPVSSWGD